MAIIWQYGNMAKKFKKLDFWNIECETFHENVIFIPATCNWVCASHCAKRVRLSIFFGPYFPAFRMNTEIYSVNCRIQSECRKIRIRKTLNTETFSQFQFSLESDYLFVLNWAFSLDCPRSTFLEIIKL